MLSVEFGALREGRGAVVVLSTQPAFGGFGERYKLFKIADGFLAQLHISVSNLVLELC